MSAHRNHDRTEYIVRDPSDWQGAAFIYGKVSEAFDHWKEDRNCDVMEINPVENICNRLNDDFEDWADEDAADARSLQRHYNSLRVSA